MNLHRINKVTKFRRRSTCLVLAVMINIVAHILLHPGYNHSDSMQIDRCHHSSQEHKNRPAKPDYHNPINREMPCKLCLLLQNGYVGKLDLSVIQAFFIANFTQCPKVDIVFQNRLESGTFSPRSPPV